MPKVSIIMNCLNGAKYLKQALDSIYAQTYADWDIVFWDNASTDNSADVAKSYGEKLYYYRGDKTVPLGVARNLALSKARGEYIAFLDCDDLWMKDKLEKQIKLFECDPEIGLVFSDAYLIYEALHMRLPFFRKKKKPIRGYIFSHTLKNYARTFCMPCIVISKKALYKQKEWFDERFHVATDFDLFLRIAHDFKCDYVDEPLVKYRIWGNSTSKRMLACEPRELCMTLKKFNNLYPHFANTHKNEINYLKHKIAYLSVRKLWAGGNGRCARKLMILQSDKYRLNYLLFLSTFLPYMFVSRIALLITSVLLYVEWLSDSVYNVLNGERNLA